MLKILKNLFNENKRKLDQYQKIVEQINQLEPDIKKLSDEDLAAQTRKFKQKISDYLLEHPTNNEQELQQKEKEILDLILPEVYATVREVSRRVLGLRHFDVQLIAGIALHNGLITEQKTGEGKTLTVTAPLYLNSLLQKGVHLVTVNDYLAEIGVGWMGPIYEFLGVSTAVIIHDQAKLYDSSIDSESRGDERLEHFKKISRRQAYQCDITYGTNNEFGFDYLRDNMVQNLSQMVQRVDTAHNFAIVDEADSILIDEARTPLIISAPDTEPTSKYYEYAKMVRSLTKNQDYTIDEKARSVTLTDLGIKRLEKKLKVDNLYEESYDTIHHIETALKANALYKRDQEYIVRDNKVVIVDEHTGRLMFGRRYSDGLHQAIEAKEGVPIQQESKTLATISIQNYFRQYSKLAGMTGTAVTEAEEFKQIYDCDVLEVPTNKPVIRDDKSDVIYKTTAAKYTAIAQEIEEIHKTGRPILVGTKSIEHNQIISKYLQRKKIKHQVLNAKNHEKEAFIIADAGKKGAITVATNIAGRGVDIVLGGAKPELKDFRLTKSKSKNKNTDQDYDLDQLNLPASIDPEKYDLTKYAQALTKWKAAHQDVVDRGGLYIIGTQRHESRRIDNQFRGRAGRQGDPGTSQFFVALDDDIMRIFGGEQISRIMDFLKIEENQAIEHKMVSKAIESAQVKVEGFFFDQRKRLVEFDDVMNKHREIIYQRRKRLLLQSILTQLDDDKKLEISKKVIEKLKDQLLTDDNKQSLKSQILDFIEDEVKLIVDVRAADNFDEQEIDAIVKEFIKIIPFDDDSQFKLKQKIKEYESADRIKQELMSVVNKTYESKEKVLDDQTMRQIERMVTLNTIDEKWIDHLDEMDSLKEGIWLRGDKQTVISEYKKEAFEMFEKLIQNINSTISSRIFRVHPVNRPVKTTLPKNMKMQKEDINEGLAKEVADATVPQKATITSKTAGSASAFANVLSQAKAGKKRNPGVKKAKIGRNDPCPCGSGKKYKKCCLLKSQ